jgi:hypothetical protein
VPVQECTLPATFQKYFEERFTGYLATPYQLQQLFGVE